MFTLIFRKGNLSVRYGCTKQPAAPRDLVIQHQDYWMYTLPDGTVKHKYGNVYYHPALPCICAQVVTGQATPVHCEFILAMLGVNI